MRKLNILFLSFLLILFSSACQDDIGDHIVKGEDLSQFTTLSPAQNAFISVNIGQPDKQVIFSWNPSESGLGSDVTYKVLFDNIDGDYSMPLLTINSDNEGASTTAKVKYSDLQKIIDEIKKDGDTEVTVSWTVEASNGSEYRLKSESSTFKMPISDEGLSSVNLGLPTDKFILDVNGDDEILFNWTKSTSTTSGSVVKYQLLIDNLTGDFSNPILTLDSDNQGLDTLIKKTPSDFKDALAGKLSNDSYKWTVKAYTENFSIFAEDVKTFFLPTLPSMYIVGGAVADIEGDNGWLIEQAIELKGIAKNVYSGVIKLRNDRQGGEFKFFPVKGSWDNGIGKDNFDEFIGDCAANDNGNINFTGTDGEYMVYVDLNTKKLTITNRLYLLGGDTSADADPANSIGSQPFKDGKVQIFAYITNSSWGYKFVPTQSGWDGDFGMSEEGYLIQEGESNLAVTEEGFYHIAIDFNDASYNTTKVDWGIIGDATADGWNSDQNMTFVPLAGGEKKGSYKWTITTDLVVGTFKFRANDGWDINLGDNDANGSLEQDGSNVEISEAGSYTIELILAPSGYTYTVTKN